MRNIKQSCWKQFTNCILFPDLSFINSKGAERRKKDSSSLVIICFYASWILLESLSQTLGVRGPSYPYYLYQFLNISLAQASSGKNITHVCTTLFVCITIEQSHGSHRSQGSPENKESQRKPTKASES